MRSLRFLLWLLFSFVTCALPATAADWPPVLKEELEMKSYAPKPGTHAVILYREERRDDVNNFEEYYYRIKIFSTEGKEQGNIEIPYVKGLLRVSDVKARTIRPDGSAVEFKGQIFDKTIVKSRGVKILARTFSLPDVDVGSILEYRYRLNWDPQLLFSTRWVLQEKLPTRRAFFQLRAYPQLRVVWIGVRLPGGRNAEIQKDGTIQLAIENIPPFEEEEFMPPENELKMRVDFFYTRGQMEQPDQFWLREGKEWHEAVEQFIGKRGTIAQAAREAVQPGDPPEAQLRKLYARAQQIRNLSYEHDKTAKEEKREKIKDNNNVEDVLKHGFGYHNQINRLFVALARAAGFEAVVVRISKRDEYFFAKQLLDADQLNGEIAYVRAGQQEFFLDPGTLFCPFGLLSWPRSGVQGIRLDKQGGQFVTTPQPQSGQALVRRVAKLRLEQNGTLQGKLQVEFLGLEALSRRLDAYDEDDAGKGKLIEDEIKDWLPSSATTQITNIANWEGSDEPLRVECDITLPGFGTATGRRLLLPTAVFQAGGKHPFRHAERIHPVYFNFPFQRTDDVTIELPVSLRVESLPGPRNDTAPFGLLEARREQQGNAVRLQRHFALNGFYFRSEHYPMLRSFYDSVRAADEERIVLQAGQAVQNR